MNGRNSAAELARIRGIRPLRRALPDCSTKKEWKAVWASTRRSGSWGFDVLAISAKRRLASASASGERPRAAARRAASPSMASRISYMSRISAAVNVTTSTVRLLFDVFR